FDAREHYPCIRRIALSCAIQRTGDPGFVEMFGPGVRVAEGREHRYRRCAVQRNRKKPITGAEK
ncbi:MAG: hypothetical protein PHE39_05530, partial [Methanoculleus bourgensis]|nr:hypothetical protein [Methanoculleus bourgensis]